MSRIKGFVDSNRVNRIRVEKERKETLSKIKQEQAERDARVKEDNEKKFKNIQEEYKVLCGQLKDYIDPVPEIFEKYGPLQNRWRALDAKTLETIIWSAPLTLLSKMFKKSDNGVRKWAREYKILLPKAGYWAKVRAGKEAYPNGLPNKKYSSK